VSSVDPGAPGPSFSTPTRAPSHVRHGISPSDAAPDAGRLRSRAPRVPGHDIGFRFFPRQNKFSQPALIDLDLLENL
jgi:hypothetical protein